MVRHIYISVTKDYVFNSQKMENKFIELTSSDGTKMLVNVSHIKRIDYSDSVNVIGISNNGAIEIKETIEEIKQLIKNK
jgi:hypothetical protein